MSRPLDPRLLRVAPTTRRLLIGYGLVQGAVAVLIIAQAVLLGSVVADIVRLRHPSELGTTLALLAVVLGGRALLAGTQEWLAARGSLAVRAELRSTVLSAVRRLGPGWVRTQPAGRLVTAAGPGLESLDGYLSRALPALVSAAVVPAAAWCWIGVTDWRTGVILLVVLPLVPLFMALVGVTTGRRMQRQYETLARMSGHFLDLVSGLTTLRVYGRAEQQVSTVRRATETYRRHTMATLRTAFLSGLVLDLLATLSIAVVAVDIGLRLDHGQLALSTALTVLLLAPELFAPLRAVGAQHHATEEGRIAIAAALDVIAEAPAPGGVGDASPVLDGAVRLDGVTVRYAGRDDDAVQAVSVQFEPGSVVALRGRSGGGKSTMLALVLGFVQPVHGAVCIGAGQPPLADLDAAAWRDNVAWLPQRPVPTQATVADEVRLGDPAATSAQIASAVALCHAPHPDTPLGEDGGSISAGQLRRVALARAALRARRQIACGATPVLLLDEPSEDLDRETEHVVCSVIGSFRGIATVVVATHSDTLAGVADRVIDVSDGRIVADIDQCADRIRVEPLTPPAHRLRTATSPVEPTDRNRVLPARATLRMLATAGALSGLAGLAGLALTATSIWLICRAAQHPNVQALEIAVVGVRTFALARALLRYLERLVAHDGALRLLADVRGRVFAALVPLVPTAVNLRRGDLLRRFVTDVDGVQEGLVRALVPLIGATVTAAGAVALAAVLLPGAGLALAGGLLTAVLVAPLVAGLVSGPATSVATLAATRDVAATTLIDGLAELSAYGADASAVAGIDRLSTQIHRASRRPALGAALGAALSGLAVAIVLPATLAVGARASVAGRITGIDVAVLLACVLAGFDAASGVPAAGAAWSRFRAGLARVTALLATPAAMREPIRPVMPPHGRNGLVFTGADIAPSPDAATAVTSASLRLDAGRRVAVIGPSGCGKSTLLSAALRLLPAHRGHVEVQHGGERVALRDVPSTAVPSVIAGSLQGDHVFDASLRDNLRVVRPEATDAELDAVAGRVGLSELIERLPAGWATPARADGAALSGGQRQRLLLGRALLAAPQILVLDEPTAHLDAETEAAVLADLLDSTRGQTVLLTTHRQLPVGSVDAVVELAGPDTTRITATSMKACEVATLVPAGVPARAMS